jgi:large subunit ribosomal protein L7/L12
MTVTLGWGAIAAVVGLAVLAFWLGRVTAGGRARGDLSGPPQAMPQARPPAASRAAPPSLSPDQRAAIQGELARGNKITAIKLLREATGLGLAEAKQAVEAMEG